MPQVSRDLLVDLWYPGEIKPEPAEPASADGLLYMFLHRVAAGNRRGAIRYSQRRMCHIHVEGMAKERHLKNGIVLWRSM